MNGGRQPPLRRPQPFKNNAAAAETASSPYNSYFNGNIIIQDWFTFIGIAYLGAIHKLRYANFIQILPNSITLDLAILLTLLIMLNTIAHPSLPWLCYVIIQISSNVLNFYWCYLKSRAFKHNTFHYHYLRSAIILLKLLLGLVLSKQLWTSILIFAIYILVSRQNSEF